MDQERLHSSTWYNALSLTERLASRRAAQGIPAHVKLNTHLAARRRQHWRSQLPFATHSYFTQRLAMDGMSEDEFVSLLGEPIEAIRARFPAPPAWLAELAQAFSRSPSSEPIPQPELLRGQGITGFLDAIEPLTSHGRDCLHQGVQALTRARSDLPFDPHTVEEILFATLPGRLIPMLSRTMGLELNVARLQGLLEGESPEERFQSFVQRLQQRDMALAFLQEYPVLARQVIIGINQWVAFSLEFLQHLSADWEGIRTTFNPEHDPGMLVQVDGEVGDSHRGGRSVLIARFSSGFQVVYKPRPMTLDGNFQDLLTWMNERGDHAPFLTLKIIDRGTYGWVEFVRAQCCTSPEQMRRFYERQGGYLALLYALEATDLHCENLIAAGEHPVLVDLEALFHPRVGGTDVHQADALASGAIQYSVLRVGLL